ncbi:RecQ family ATP-dependent DNA helicase [Fulvivirga sediminis]|uniref:ATP-dependent DNA helicase RecQ n=1 Tax=Fulvivirga sediminis TaxID=2803949 RepID=A0A937FC75_9BACT|nr:RecQ family ATP-dependent DNA helicase [Fulvivirga sediminis]MBL3658514.1 RecQ family ATP-dependent DNA helicase [Fulvivirga sediminis]
MKPTLEVLKKYWGYDSFREVQEEIVDSVLAGHDTLALLPTGGGKSVCFQVPAMLKEGVCIVITPLIALMKDQVEQLKKRGIKAEAIYSGMGKREIDIKLDNCVYGAVKFLYLSPERLQTDLFQERVQKMKVGLLAVDESHCISQWGYDFRPAYLHIAEIRELIPQVNVIALTATATPEVKADIQDKLQFKNGQVFQKSFSRSNLSYSVREVEDKERKLLEVLRNVKGTAIVYARSRKGTKEIAQFLYKNGISADFYNAGLTHEERVRKQDEWINDKRRVMVATNAFGMGIDKPDVRVVVHMELPQDIESYYQEAGRAGRDEKKAYAVIIHNQSDLEDLAQKIRQQYPSVEFMKKVYQCLANYYKLAVGSGLGQSFNFDIQEFSDMYQLNHMEVYYALKKLEEEELIQFNESFYNPSLIHIAVDNRSLYEFQIANAKYDVFIKVLLRIYGGELFNNFMKISEVQIAKLLGVSDKEVVKMLQKLAELGILDYDERKDKPQVFFSTPRKDATNLKLNQKRLQEREDNAISKMKAMINYVQNTDECRTRLLLEYFGEMDYDQCGVCDVCVANKNEGGGAAARQYEEEVIKMLTSEPHTLDELIFKMPPASKDVILEMIREMIDVGDLMYDEQRRLHLSQ